MLDCAQLYLELLAKLGVLFAEIARCDVDLARQLRRASASVALNLAEGFGSTKGTKRARYESAYASLAETRMGLAVAVRLGYIAPLDAALERGLDRVAGALWKLQRR